MSIQCTPTPLAFHAFGRRQVVGRFDAGRLTSDGGTLLLREVDRRLGLMGRVAGCFSDYRDPDKVEHSVLERVTQRVGGIALGYEDLNDHDALRTDSLLALWAGKADLTGAQRSRERDRGYALAGSSPLNRLELSRPEAAARDRYHRIAADTDALDRVLVDLFLDAHTEAPEEVWLDLDATDDPLHGDQEGRFFHGYYRTYCYLPLYIFCGEHLLCARLRPSNRDASAGSVEELTRIVGRLRQRWPRVRVVVRERNREQTGVDWLAPGARGGSGRCRILPGADHALVRGPRRGLRARSGSQRAPGGADREGPAQVPQSIRDHRRTVAAFPGVWLPDLLEPHAPGGGQGGASGEGVQPALRGDQPGPQGGGAATALRAPVLRTR